MVERSDAKRGSNGEQSSIGELEGRLSLHIGREKAAIVAGSIENFYRAYVCGGLHQPTVAGLSARTGGDKPEICLTVVRPEGFKGSKFDDTWVRCAGALEGAFGERVTQRWEDVVNTRITFVELTQPVSDQSSVLERQARARGQEYLGSLELVLNPI